MFTAATALVALLTAGDAHAAKRVLVSTFEARNRSMRSTAAALPAHLEQAFLQDPRLDVVPIDALPAVSDMSAARYAESCPPGEFIGCAFVLGQAGGVDLAVAGAVEELRDGVRVEVHVLDVDRSEDVLAFQVDFADDDADRFAAGIGAVVSAVARGEVQLAGDIRARKDPGERYEQDRERMVAQRQLDTLSQEIGDVDSVDRLEKGRIEREKVSMDELVEDMEGEGSKPWDRLDMTVQEYLKFRNSGLSLYDWRRRAMGRKNQLIIRPYLGFGRGPYDQRYFARYLQSADDFSVLETYSWQATEQTSGLTYGASVTYGILPVLEVGLTVGGSMGEYHYEINKQTEGQSPTQIPPEASGNSMFFVGPEVLVSLMPTSSIRPVFGGGFTYWRGSSVDDHILLPEDLRPFDDGTAIITNVLLGGEARLSDTLDVFIHLPVTMLVGGNTKVERRDRVLELNTGQPPQDPGTIGAGVNVGFQVRLFGPKQSASPDDFNLDPE